MAFLASDIVKTVVKLWSIKVNAGHEFLPSGAIRDQHRKELGLEGLISITIEACVPDLCWDILKNFFFSRRVYRRLGLRHNSSLRPSPLLGYSIPERLLQLKLHVVGNRILFI